MALLVLVVVLVLVLWRKLRVLLLILVLVVVVVWVWVVVLVGVLLFLEVIRQWPELGSWKVLGVKHQMELGLLAANTALVEVTLLLDVLEVTQVGPTYQPPWRMRKSTCCRFPLVLGGLGISPAIP